jgi:hypothetical protein
MTSILPKNSRKLLALAGVAAALVATACGGSDGPPAVTADAAKAGVERAAGIKLTPVDLPAEAADQGLKASYTNAATVAKDKQVVALFVVKNASVADEVADQVRPTVPSGGKLIVDGNVMVVYANAGGDGHAAELTKAVQAL